MHIPVGLSSEELEQLRADALRAGPTNPRPSSYSPVATADGTTLEMWRLKLGDFSWNLAF